MLKGTHLAISNFYQEKLAIAIFYSYICSRNKKRIMATFLLITWILVCLVIAIGSNRDNSSHYSAREKNKIADERHAEMVKEMEKNEIDMLKIKYGPWKFKQMVKEGKIKLS